MFEHALVVGGTGMLADATSFIRVNSKRMTLVSRRARVAGRTMPPDRVCSADWRDEHLFSLAVSPCISAITPDIALLWMHLDGRRALLWLLRQLAAQPILIVHVVGTGGEPLARDNEIDAIIAEAAKTARVQYVRVVLGSKALPDGRRRWLENSEISSGAIEAIQSAQEIVVGEVGPVGPASA